MGKLREAGTKDEWTNHRTNGPVVEETRTKRLLGNGNWWIILIMSGELRNGVHTRTMKEMMGNVRVEGRIAHWSWTTWALAVVKWPHSRQRGRSLIESCTAVAIETSKQRALVYQLINRAGRDQEKALWEKITSTSCYCRATPRFQRCNRQVPCIRTDPLYRLYQMKNGLSRGYVNMLCRNTSLQGQLDAWF